MTQQYLAGELSALIGDLCREGDSCSAAELRILRVRVEHAPLWALPRLTAEVLDVADAACWALLAGGEVDAFAREAAEAAALREFAVCADLLPEPRI